MVTSSLLPHSRELSLPPLEAWGAPQPGGRRKALPLGSRPLPLHPSAEKSESARFFQAAWCPLEVQGTEH